MVILPIILIDFDEKRCIVEQRSHNFVYKIKNFLNWISHYDFLIISTCMFTNLLYIYIIHAVQGWIIRLHKIYFSNVVCRKGTLLIGVNDTEIIHQTPLRAQRTCKVLR